MAKSRRQSGDKTKDVKKTSKVIQDKSVRKDAPANAALSSSSDDSASGSSLTSSDDDNPNATDTSSSDDGHGPPGPPSPPSGPHRATARASRTRPRASAPRPPPNGRSDLKKPIGSK